ncbi:MAG: methyltransferase domain-containing protein [Planctomycetota bacterium]|nr:methyltransferase domain-containing protein [Planctomycetota bacterium]
MATPSGGYTVFIREFFQRYHTTGAILPSGSRLAAALCHYVTPEGNGRQILEVGPGTGPATAQLVKRLQPQDHLCLVELNDAFVAHLRHRFDSEPGFQAVANQVQILHAPLQEVPGEKLYDHIVSGLPLNNFAVEDVKSILAIFERLLKPGGTLSFFEYVAIRKVKSVISSRSERERLRGIETMLDQFLHGREIRRDRIWRNVPPAWVHHVRVGGVV